MDFAFNIIQVLANLATIGALVYVAAEYRKSNKNRKEDAELERKRATLEAYNRLQKEVLDTLYIGYTPSKISEIVDNRNKADYKEEYHRLGTMLARIEHFCTGVELQIYDNDVVYELADGFFNGSIKVRIMPLISAKDGCFEGGHYENTLKVIEKLNARKTK